MSKQRLLALVAALTATGLIAAGCGGGDSTTVTEAPTTSAETTATETTSAETTATEPTTNTDSSDSTSSGSSGSVDASAFYDACINAASGTGGAGEQAAQSICGQARDALEQCANLAEQSGDDAAAESAIQICQDAADSAVQQLENAGG